MLCGFYGNIYGHIDERSGAGHSYARRSSTLVVLTVGRPFTLDRFEEREVKVAVVEAC